MPITKFSNTVMQSKTKSCEFTLDNFKSKITAKVKSFKTFVSVFRKCLAKFKIIYPIFLFSMFFY